ncbi:MAG TPA: glycosyltransferase [Gaiellaceae bacterium]|nr:glycosyltransferase [Gaiellaceae bacterium]
MRVLFTFAGGTGHFLPLAPIARAAAARGHAVAFAGQAGMVRVVREEGFHAFDTGGPTLLQASARVALQPVDLENEERVVRDVYAGSVARERASRVLELGGDWCPDVVVSDEMDFGALVAAERLGVPWATVLCIATGALARSSLVAPPLAALRRAHGLPADLGSDALHRYLVLSPFPPSLRDPAWPLPATAHGLGPSPVDEPPPAWASRLDRSSTVYLTLGTIFNLESGDLFERALQGLRQLPVRVVVTVGRELDPGVLGRQPPNVRIERFVPQAHVLPRCALVVSHAGSGSVVGALAHGLPMVLLPLGADQPLTAARCRELGVARVLDASSASPEDVRAAAADVLATPTFRRSAEAIAREIEQLSGHGEAVTLLERLARDRTPLPGPWAPGAPSTHLH